VSRPTISSLAVVLFSLFTLACSFDRSGLGSPVDTDDAAPGSSDASSDAMVAPGEPDAKPGTADAMPDGMTSTADANTADHTGVVCGDSTCLQGRVCCVSIGGGGADYECADKCDSNGTTFACDGPEDCHNGDDCCFSQWGGSRCAKTCSVTQDVTCRVASDCPSGPGGGAQQCCPTQFPNVQVCRNFCI